MPCLESKDEICQLSKDMLLDHEGIFNQALSRKLAQNTRDAISKDSIHLKWTSKSKKGNLHHFYSLLESQFKDITLVFFLYCLDMMDG